MLSQLIFPNIKFTQKKKTEKCSFILSYFSKILPVCYCQVAELLFCIYTFGAFFIIVSISVLACYPCMYCNTYICTYIHTSRLVNHPSQQREERSWETIEQRLPRKNIDGTVASTPPPPLPAPSFVLTRHNPHAQNTHTHTCLWLCVHDATPMYVCISFRIHTYIHTYLPGVACGSLSQEIV